MMLLPKSNAVFPAMVVFCLACILIGEQSLVGAYTSNKYCGSMLNDILNLVCDGEFYSGDNKRSGKNHGYLLDQDSDNEDRDDVEKYINTLPFISRLAGSAIHPRFRREINNKEVKRNGGIADECCMKPCSFKEIAGYCLNYSKFAKRFDKNRMY